MQKSERLMAICRGDLDQTANLFVTGGGHRSARTAGMLAAIQHEGWSDSFNYYVGNSAGAFSLMFLLAGAAERGASGYWKSFPTAYHSHEFVDPWNILRADTPIMDMHYLTDIYFEEQNPIPWQAVLDHKANQEGRFLVQAMDAVTGKAIYLSRFTTVQSLKTALTATAWIPAVAGVKPFALTKEMLSEMTILDEKLQVSSATSYQVFDGQIADTYLIRSMAATPGDINLVCTNNTPDRNSYENRPNQFRQILGVFERPLSYILFWRYPEAIKTYHRNIIHNGQWDDLATLTTLQADEESNTIVSFTDHSVPADVIREAEMREAVSAGWNGFYKTIGREPSGEPSVWE